MTDGEGFSPPTRSRAWIFWLEVLYLVMLLVAIAVLSSWHDWRKYVADPIGPVPLAVPWFGALGGVMISLRGVCDHANDWRPTYSLRHIARPLTAAVSGTVAYLMLVAGIVAFGQTPAVQPSDLRSRLVYYVLAFGIGYREEVFRDLLRSALDTALGRSRRDTGDASQAANDGHPTPLAERLATGPSAETPEHR